MAGQGQEQQVTLEGIDAALAELVKAADAGGLIKALGNVAVEPGGHTDERGSTSGGYAETADIGTLDAMMIGKMQHVLIGAGFDAGSIAAFMRGKQSDDDEEEQDDEDQEMSGAFGKPAATAGGVTTGGRPRASGGKAGSGKGGGKGAVAPAPVAKSLDAFREDPAIADAMDVSPFISAVVQKTTEGLDDIRKSMESREDQAVNMTRQTAAAMYGIGQLVKSLVLHSQRLEQRLGMVEQQPRPARGQQQLSGARPLHKGMQGEAGGRGGPEQLTKSEVLSTLSYMNLEKSQSDPRYRQLGGQSTSDIIGIFEGGGGLPQHALEAVYGFLQSHPHEAAAARSYR